MDKSEPQNNLPPGQEPPQQETQGPAEEEAAGSGQEPPVFGGRNPSRSDWFTTREPEPQEEEPAEPEAPEELPRLLPDRQRREMIVRELISPFSVLLFFVLALLIGIATVNVSIPATATLKAVIHFENYKQLEGDELLDYQREQDRLLRSFETRSIILQALRTMPNGMAANFANDDLEFHHLVDRTWSPEGTLALTVESPDPALDVKRLSLLAKAMITVSERSKQRIVEAETEIARLRQERSEQELKFARLRKEIVELEPEALKQSALAEAALAMEQYLSLLEKEAPQRVAAEANLKRLRQEAEHARAVGEQRDKLVVERIAVQRKLDELDEATRQQEQLIRKVVYPLPLKQSDVSVTDLRPARYNLLWIVTLAICGIFIILLVLSFYRRARDEMRRAELQRLGQLS